ncbi:endocuticle structural protein SgAbd-6-like [Episyrphus balteatus]|uniref:endocuticle structural protein SgAbd-6-like n=1 Tax=Episyrphus balteatus TaxID=286459 RepID=UPI002485FE84|nr:endocuticle structural protein SgAbd-6-like [Episyrphus balteatus]
MKFVILLALVAFAYAAPVSEIEADETKEPIASVINSESSHDANGSYKFGFEDSNGTVREEHAVITDEGTEDEALEISGSYRYFDANGDEIEVKYTAGKNGFVPVGSIIPKEITEVADGAKNLPKTQYDEPERESALNAPRQ